MKADQIRELQSAFAARFCKDEVTPEKAFVIFQKWKWTIFLHALSHPEVNGCRLDKEKGTAEETLARQFLAHEGFRIQTVYENYENSSLTKAFLWAAW